MTFAHIEEQLGAAGQLLDLVTTTGEIRDDTKKWLKRLKAELRIRLRQMHVASNGAATNTETDTPTRESL